MLAAVRVKVGVPGSILPGDYFLEKHVYKRTSESVFMRFVSIVLLQVIGGLFLQAAQL